MRLMVTFMFWNLNLQPLHKVLARLLEAKSVNVLILAESPYEPSELVQYVRDISGLTYHFAESFGCRRVHIFTTFPDEVFSPRHEKNTFTIRTLSLPDKVPVILAATHFPSKLHWGPESQSVECQRLGEWIRRVEDEQGHKNTVLVGDLNMNPFEDGVVGAAGLHGVMSRSVAKAGSRQVQEEMYPYFYNPMWSLYGDSSPGPPGTYFHRDGQQIVYFWNMFDQVLVRPALLPRFDNNHLEVVTTDGSTSFLSANGRPDPSVASDHLPILFQLAL